MLKTLYSSILYQPMLNLLILLYNFLWSDMGLAIIAMTIIIRLILYPSFKHQLQSQKKMAELQPKLKELQNRHKDNKEEQGRAMMEFYRQNKVNPLSSCLPLIIQLVILIALFQVFQTGLNGAALTNLYPFVKNPGHINQYFFSFLDLTKPNLILAVITGIAQFFQSKQALSLQPKPDANQDAATQASASVSRQMIYIFPVMTVIFGARFPSGLAIYWLVTTLFAILQQYVIIKDKRPVPF